MSSSFKGEYVPPMPTPKIATRSPYDRILYLLTSGKAGEHDAAAELRGWLTFLDGGKGRTLSTTRLTRLAALEYAAAPGTSHGPRLCAATPRAQARRKRLAEGIPEPVRDLHPCLVSRPAPPVAPMVARGFVMGLAMVLRFAA